MLKRRGIRLALGFALTALVVVHIGVDLVVERRDVGRIVGILVEQAEAGILIKDVVEGRPAARDGLQGGDLLVAIDGAPVEFIADYDEHARGFMHGEKVIFRISRDGVTLDADVFPGIDFHLVRFLLTKVVVFFYLILGLLAISKRPDDIRVLLLFLFSSAVAVELSLPGMAFAQAHWAALFGAAFLVISGWEMALELHLATVIPSRQPWLDRHKWVIPSFYILGCAFGLTGGAIVLVETLGVRGLMLNSSDVYWALNKVLLPFWAVMVAVLLGVAAVRHEEPGGRHQAGLVLLAVTPWVLFTLATVLFPSLLNQASWYYGPLQSLALLCYPIAVFFAIFRYKLFDIEFVVRRGLVYTVLTLVLVIFFFAFVGAAGTTLSTIAAETSAVWVVSAATLLLGLLFSPLRTAVQEFVDRRFFPERYALRQRLISLAEELPSLGKLPKMGDFLARKLREIFEVETVTLLIGDPTSGILTTLASTEWDLESRLERSLFISPDDAAVQELVKLGRPVTASSLRHKGSVLALQLDALETTLVVPMATHGTLIGLLLLGERERKERYPAEELELLNLLSHNVAATFENARLFESATYEGLTGLLRREPILDRLKGELARAVRYDRPLTVAMADLDRFKDVNDNYGHLSGDAVLKRVAKTIGLGLRGSDAVGRFGGDEFIIVLPETTRADGAAVAEKIRGAVEDLLIRAEDGREIRITMSFGLASVEQLDKLERIEVSDLIALADTKLYTAKREGRNRVEPPPSSAN